MANKPRELPRELTDRLMQHLKPLNKREYEAIKVNIGVQHACRLMSESLEERLRTIPYGWRDAKMLESRWRMLFDKLLYTIPAEKLKTLKHELPYSEMYVRMKGAARYDSDESDYVALPRKTEMALAEYAVEMNCPLCDKKGKQISKCRLKRTLDASLPFEPQIKGEGCPYCDYGVDKENLWGDDDE